MDEMERHGDILTWDKQTGEILFKLKKISDRLWLKIITISDMPV